MHEAEVVVTVVAGEEAAMAVDVEVMTATLAEAEDTGLATARTVAAEAGEATAGDALPVERPDTLPEIAARAVEEVDVEGVEGTVHHAAAEAAAGAGAGAAHLAGIEAGAGAGVVPPSRIARGAPAIGAGAGAGAHPGAPPAMVPSPGISPCLTVTVRGHRTEMLNPKEVLLIPHDHGHDG